MKSERALSKSVVMLRYQQSLYLPIRLRTTLIENIIEQIEDGIDYNIFDNPYHVLDQFFNQHLDAKYKAPSVKQVKFASVIANTLELDPDPEVFQKQYAVEAFIEEHREAFYALTSEEK